MLCYFHGCYNTLKASIAYKCGCNAISAPSCASQRKIRPRDISGTRDGEGKIGGASYLVWLECRGLGLDHDALVDLFVDKAHLALNDGEMFGSGGEGFMRLNAGTTRATLRRALDAIALAVRSL